jgi:hypothetical protein
MKERAAAAWTTSLPSNASGAYLACPPQQTSPFSVFCKKNRGKRSIWYRQEKQN